MRRAAGAEVYLAYFHKAQSLRHLALTAVAELRQLLGGGKPRLHRKICAHRLVCKTLHVHKCLPVKLTAEIYGHTLGAHVEAHVFKPVLVVYDAGDYVLAGMILHTAQALLGVDAAGVASRLKGAVRKMQYLPAALLNVVYAQRADIARVGSLSASLGKEGRAVKNKRIARLQRPALQQLRLKFKDMTVLMI